MENAMEEYLAHGFEEKNLRDAAVSHVKDLYLSGNVDEDEAIRLLWEYKGLDENEAYWKIDAWRSKDEAEEAGEDFQSSNYRDLYAAIDKNEDIGTAMKELTSHGYKESTVRDAAKSHLVERFEKDQINEQAFRNQLSRYCKIVKTSDVNEIVTKARCFKETGVRLGSINETYLDGEISGTELTNILTRYGGKTRDEAAQRKRWLDVQKQYPTLEISETICNAWYDGTAKTRENRHETAKSTGISVQKYVEAREILSEVTGTDKDGDGKTDSYSKEIAYIKAISGISGLTGRQRWALYYEVYKGANFRKISRPNW